MRSVENEECRKCGVWKIRSVENEECGKSGVRKVRSIGNEEYGKWGVRKMRSARQSEQCGKWGVWKMWSVENYNPFVFCDVFPAVVVCLRSLLLWFIKSRKSHDVDASVFTLFACILQFKPQSHWKIPSERKVQLIVFHSVVVNRKRSVPFAPGNLWKFTPDFLVEWKAPLELISVSVVFNKYYIVSRLPLVEKLVHRRVIPNI